jgi:hypothetical protein
MALTPSTNELQVKKAKEIADGNKGTRHAL